MEQTQTERHNGTAMPATAIAPSPLGIGLGSWWPCLPWVATASANPALESLAAKVAVDWAHQELPVMANLSAASQTELLRARVKAVESQSLLTADEAEAYLRRITGHSDAPTESSFTPAGFPSIYSILTAAELPDPTQDITVAGAITVGLATVGGGYLGSLVGGPVGAWVGAAAAAAIAAEAVSGG